MRYAFVFETSRTSSPTKNQNRHAIVAYSKTQNCCTRDLKATFVGGSEAAQA